MSKGAKTAIVVGAVIVGLAVVFSVIPGLAWGRNGYAGWGMMGWPAFGGFGFMFLMPLLWLVLIGLIIWAVVAAIGHSHTSQVSSSSTALEILKQRYAKGEISKEEYEAKKKDLGGQ